MHEVEPEEHQIREEHKNLRSREQALEHETEVYRENVRGLSRGVSSVTYNQNPHVATVLPANHEPAQGPPNQHNYLLRHNRP